MKFCLTKREEGSVTPLILGFVIIIAAIIATLSDITYLGNAHLVLKSEGQRVLAEALRNVSSVDYYQGNSEVGRSVPIDCQNTYFNILREVQEAKFYLSHMPLMVRGYACKNSWVQFEISAKVSLPFLPRFLADVNPTVSSLISGGSRYFSD